MLCKTEMGKIHQQLQTSLSASQRRKLRKKLVEHNYATNLPPFTPQSHRQCYMNKFTTKSTMEQIIDAAQQTSTFTLDTESVNVFKQNNKPALIQIQFIQCDTYSTVVLIETNHLPPPSSETFAQIRQVCRIVLKESNTIYTWGKLTELDEFLSFRLFTREQINAPNNRDLQQEFKRYWQEEHPHQSIEYCQCETCIGKDPNESWSLQDAVANQLKRWLDKRHTRSTFDMGLDPAFQHSSSAKHQLQQKLTIYAANDCLSMAELIATMYKSIRFVQEVREPIANEYEGQRQTYTMHKRRRTESDIDGMNTSSLNKRRSDPKSNNFITSLAISTDQQRITSPKSDRQFSINRSEDRSLSTNRSEERSLRRPEDQQSLSNRSDDRNALFNRSEDRTSDRYWLPICRSGDRRLCAYRIGNRQAHTQRLKDRESSIQRFGNRESGVQVDTSEAGLCFQEWEIEPHLESWKDRTHMQCNIDQLEYARVLSHDAETCNKGNRVSRNFTMDEKKARNRKCTLKQRERNYRTEIIRRGIDDRFSVTMVKAILRHHQIEFDAINISKSSVTGRTSLYIGIRNRSTIQEDELRTRELFTTQYYNEFRARPHAN
jgi:hypothetical protein